MRAALILTAIAALSLTVSLSGCSSGADQRPAAGSTVPVVVPGRPGESARTAGPQEAATLVPTPTANAVDVKYAQDMIVHHRQALDMAVLAPTRARSAKLKTLASRIQDAQAPEIQFMTSWLQEQRQRLPGHHAGHAGMPGMAAPEQMEALKAATGEEFDRLFLRLMIAHHQGAITMSRQVLTGGSHLRIQELAGDVTAGQSAEIRHMLAMQAAP
ncbi:DUF305 domain-containing protein [Planomonospora sp. ID67723]|uniref:DUF305 domain-containing protein n=1 Tax=Planomonospora sp. ID67723 TaxID=2738134 RepID=UPI0018C3B74C|nr:DUF305 domain-containing protein [Planomonospora sp. ID67723]MBG0828063.1 DUF305 domain-containing protein [Planomonospora sp. ID67723]